MRRLIQKTKKSRCLYKASFNLTSTLHQLSINPLSTPSSQGPLGDPKRCNKKKGSIDDKKKLTFNLM